MIVYVDSVILIYYLDSVGLFQTRAAQQLALLAGRGDVVAISDLSRLECRVRPLRLGQQAVLARFDAFFQQPDVHKVPLTAAVYDRAAEIRAVYNYRTIDAIHLAAASVGRCDRFLTNDNRLSGFADTPVDILP